MIPTWYAVVTGILGVAIPLSLPFFRDMYAKKKEIREIERVANEHKNPVLYAAYELNKRLNRVFMRLKHPQTKDWFECKGRCEEKYSRVWLDECESQLAKRYFFAATVYSIAKFIAQIEIFHRTAIGLDFATSFSTKEFMQWLQLIRAGFCEKKFSDDLRIYRDQNRQEALIFEYFFQSIGDAMIEKTKDTFFEVMPFSEFFSKYKYEENDKSDKRTSFRIKFRSISSLLIGLRNGSKYKLKLDPNDQLLRIKRTERSDEDKNILRWDRLVTIAYLTRIFLEKNDKNRLFPKKNFPEREEDQDVEEIERCVPEEHWKKIKENIEAFTKAFGLEKQELSL